jgi:hypothetical protein
MPHEFISREEEPDPQAAGGRSVGPPRKHIAAGVLDPPFPPKKPLEPIPAAPRSTLVRIFVILILVGLLLAALLMIWKIL